MATVRAKFWVETVNHHPVWVYDKTEGMNVQREGGSVVLHPVYGGSPENEAFFAATPGGTIQLNVLNKAALDAFTLHGEYYVDFTKVDPS